MKRLISLLFVALCPTVLVVAQNSGVAAPTIAAVCNSACVTEVNGVAACDRECTDRSGHCVALDDQGNFSKVQNRDECRGITYRPVKSSGAKETEQQAERDLRIEELYNQAP